MDPKQETPQDTQATPVPSSNPPAPSPAAPAQPAEQPQPTGPSLSPQPGTSVPPTAQVPTATVTSSADQPPKGKSKLPLIMIIIVVVLLVAGGVVYFMMKNSSSKPVAMTPTQKVQPSQAMAKPTNLPTPVISPVTTGNVDQTLNSTDSKVKQATDQATTDMNNVNTNSTQDNTKGL